MGEILGDLFKYDPNYHRFAEFLGIDRYKREDIDVARKISYIRDYLDLKKNRSETEALSALSELKRGLGIQYSGQELLNELYQHTRLESDRLGEHPEVSKKEPPKEEKKIEKKVEEEPKPVVKAPNFKKQVEEAISSYFDKAAQDFKANQGGTYGST